MASKARAKAVGDALLLAEFKTDSEGNGYKPYTVASNVSALRQFLVYLRDRGVAPDSASSADVKAFLRKRVRRFRQQHDRSPKNADWLRQYTNPIDRFLRLVQGQWPPAPQSSAKPNEQFHRDVIEGYGRWLIEVRGLSEATLEKNCRAAGVFIDWLGRRASRRSLGRLTIADIDGFLAWRLSALRRATRSGQCVCLRSFLRYLFWADLLSNDLSVAVRGPIIYQHAEIPRAFTEPQIKKILGAARADRSAKGMRDYAILLMLATYGLRSGEVTWMRLDDIDWRGEKLRIRRSKTRTESTLPLVAPVARALLKYLRHGRPTTKLPHLFLRSRAPIVPLRHVSYLNGIIESRMRQAGIAADGRHGSHAFRFARALSLLRAAVPMKSIGDLLGHRTTRSTEVYLRLDTEDLRAISLDLPGKDHDASMVRKPRVITR
ncbi:MAG TPA: tyrosine-type recombinase/integrase [Bryobacteraceae bacterium]|nr:tyrosine-type recombinase/integrase [Bryobacteraceae bacterium]